MTEQKLKPCPFCGGEAKICQEKGAYWEVACEDCYASVGVYNCYEDKGEAIEAWNKRVGEVAE